MKNDWIRDMQPIRLHEPVFDVCVTVFEALKMRRTSRAISNEKISMQILSDVLRAEQGINRVRDLSEARVGLRDRRVIRRRSVFMLP